MNKYIKISRGNFAGNLLLTLKEEEKIDPEAFINKELAGVKEKVDIDSLVSEVNSLLDMAFTFDPDDVLTGEDSYNYEVGTQNLYDALLYSGYFRNSKELDKAYNDLLDMAENGKASLEYMKAYLEAPSGDLKEGYSLGDDKESFDVWEKEEKKLKDVVDSLKENGIDFTNIDIEHSQDSIYSADFFIKGIPESNINDELEDELRDKFVSGYDSYFENIQLENWSGYGPICIIGFDINSADSSKWRFGNKVKEVINIVSKDGLKESRYYRKSPKPSEEDYENIYKKIEETVYKIIGKYSSFSKLKREEYLGPEGGEATGVHFSVNYKESYGNINKIHIYVYVKEQKLAVYLGYLSTKFSLIAHDFRGMLNDVVKAFSDYTLVESVGLKESKVFDANSENTMETIRNYMNNYEKNTPNGGSVLFRTYTDGDYDYDVRIYPGANGKNPEAWAEPYEYSKDEDGNEHWEALDNIITLDDFKIDMTDDELDKYAKKSIGIKEAFDYKAQFENQEGTEKEEGDNYTVYRYSDSNGKPIAVMFYGRTQRPNFHIRFNDEERREKYIQDFLDSKKQREEEKAERRKATRLTKDHDIKVGDIFYTCWGYDQTNIDYYQVVDIRGSRIDLREIGQEVVDRYPGGEEVVPVKDSFTSDEIQTVSARADGTVTKLSSFEYPTKWDGKPHHQTDGYSGH